jgi:hypothetical protein
MSSPQAEQVSDLSPEGNGMYLAVMEEFQNIDSVFQITSRN